MQLTFSSVHQCSNAARSFSPLIVSEWVFFFFHFQPMLRFVLDARQWNLISFWYMRETKKSCDFKRLGPAGLCASSSGLIMQSADSTPRFQHICVFFFRVLFGIMNQIFINVLTETCVSFSRRRKVAHGLEQYGNKLNIWLQCFF